MARAAAILTLRRVTLRMRHAGILAIVTALACATAAVASLSPAAYRAQAGAICKSGKANLNALGQPKTDKDVGTYLAASLPIARAELAALRRLSPPASLRAGHTQAVSYFGKELDLLAAAVKKIQAGADPIQQFNAITVRETSLGKGEDAGWRKAGVKACTG
jgi:hypothetical protein